MVVSNSKTISRTTRTATSSADTGSRYSEPSRIYGPPPNPMNLRNPKTQSGQFAAYWKVSGNRFHSGFSGNGIPPLVPYRLYIVFLNRVQTRRFRGPVRFPTDKGDGSLFHTKSAFRLSPNIPQGLVHGCPRTTSWTTIWTTFGQLVMVSFLGRTFAEQGGF